jgi:hypothetical protein
MLTTPPPSEVVQVWNTTIDSNLHYDSLTKKLYHETTSSNKSDNIYYKFLSSNFNHSLQVINSFKALKPNWDTYNGLEISDLVIKKSISILSKLNEIPDIFPTGRGSIQFEFEKQNGDYLEFEIFEDSIKYYLKTKSIEEENNLDNSDDIKFLISQYNDTK